jgi:hypothetical protein
LSLFPKQYSIIIVYIALTCIRCYKSSKDDIKTTGLWVETPVPQKKKEQTRENEVICKYCAILYKEFEHLWILVSSGVQEPILDTKRTIPCAVKSQTPSCTPVKQALSSGLGFSHGVTQQE